VGSAQFGPYLLDAVLARGGSATVYRARDTSHDERVVAVKVFDRRLSADPGFRERFRRDAGLLSALREPHVVPIHRYGEIDGHLYLDMRLVRGPSLADVLRRGRLAPQRAEAIAGQIGAAVDALRRGGLGDRRIERSDVLLAGGPGRGEFVQLVGLGLGRPPVQAAVSPTALVSRPARHRRLVASTAAVLVVAALVAWAVFPRDRERVGEPSAATGLVATIGVPDAGLLDAAVVSVGGRRLLAGVTADGALRTWDLSTGAEAGPATPGDAVAVATAVVDGRAVAVVRRRDNTVVARDLETGTPLGPPMGTPREYSFGRLVVVEVDGEPVVVALEPTGRQLPGPFDMTEEQVGVSSFALRTGAPAGPVLAADGASIDAFSVTEIDGRPVVVSSTAGGGGVQARDLRTGAPVGAPTAPQPVAFRALTTAVRDGVPVAVTGGDDNTVRIWDLRTGEQVGAPLAGHVESVTAVVAVQQDGRTVLITAGGSDLSPTPQVRFWELATGTPLGPPMTDHPLSRGFRALSPDGSLLLTTAPGEPVAVWDAKQLVAEVAS